MSIWFKRPTLSRLKEDTRNTVVERLGIEFVEIGDDYLKATMPVDSRTRQPMGVLHGGASAVLAETLASGSALFCIDPSMGYCLGLGINANHVRPITEGYVTGVSKAVHVGKKTHIWDVLITDAENRLVCTSRVTMAIMVRLDDKATQRMVHCLEDT